MQDMEKAVMGDREVARLDYTKDVMEIMTGIRKEYLSFSMYISV